MDTKSVGAVVLLVIGGLFMGGIGGGTAFAHNGAVQENVEITGIVQDTGVDKKVTTDSEGNREVKYRPIVTYEYEVDGETYEQDNVFPGSFTRWQGSRSWAEGVAGDYQQGEEIAVFYNPRDNSHAYIRNDGLPGSWVIGAGYGVIAAIAGAWFIWVGFKRRKQRALMEDTPTEQAESLSMGPSEVKGSAVPEIGEPQPAPFSEEECVIAQWEIEEYRDDHDDDGGSWHTVAEGYELMPLYVDDGTGQVLVRPDVDATFELEPEDWTTVTVDSATQGPAPVQAFVDARQDIDYPSDGGGRDGDRRYKQNLIEPDEDIYVFGTVQPTDGAGGTANEDNLLIQKVGEDDPRMEPMFMISDDTEQDLVANRQWALWRLPVGVVFALVGVGIILGIAGPMIGIELPIPPKVISLVAP